MSAKTVGRPKLYDIRLPVKLTEEMDEWLQREAERRGLSKSDIIREAVDEKREGR